MKILELTTENFSRFRQMFLSLLQENMQTHIDAGRSSQTYCEETTDRVAKYLATGHAVVLLAMEGETVLGLAWGYPRQYLDQNQLFLQLIQVHETYRSRGVGAALIHEFERFAASHGYTQIELITSVENDGAQAFYKRARFHATRIHYAKGLSHE